MYISRLSHYDLRFTERNLLYASNISINTFLALLKRQTLKPVTSPQNQQCLIPLPYQPLELSTARRLWPMWKELSPNSLFRGQLSCNNSDTKLVLMISLKSWSILQLEMSLFQSSHMPISAPGGGHNFHNCGSVGTPTESRVISSGTQ